MTAMLLPFIRLIGDLAIRHWRIVLPSVAALCVIGWQAWTIADLRRDLAAAETRAELATKRLELAAAVALAAQADADKRAADAANKAANAGRDAAKRAEKVRKEIDHAEDGDVAGALRAALDGLRGQ